MHAFDHLRIGGGAEVLQRPPDLQRLEGAGELRAVVGEIDEVRVLRHRQVAGVGVEGVVEMAAVANEDAAGFVGAEEEFVGIEGDRVGKGEGGELGLEAAAQGA